MTVKLLLSSDGFCTPEIIEKTAELVCKTSSEISVAVINEAYAMEPGDHGWVLDDLNRIKDNFGGMELVNLLALDIETIRQRILQADVIFVVGGHTDYLMSVFDKTGFSKLLPVLLRTKVYVGSSAGSMVVGKRISTEAYQKTYGEANNFGVSKYLELVNFAIKPHLGSSLFPNNREEILREAVKEFRGTMYGLTDNMAVVVEDDERYFIGGEPLTIVSA